MQLVKNNPYRTIGLLVGATAREQERQIKRLKQFIEAEQEPQDDFSFPAMGKLHRTIDSVTEATAKLNLDNDKMNAALFWFFKGNAITDEPAFDSLKESNIENCIEIWSKLTRTEKVTERNNSAFQNLSTLLLSNAFNGTNVNTILFEQAISLKLKFLESDFIKEFKSLATDETFKTTKKDLQLLFLNQLQIEIEKNGGISLNKFLEILNKEDFSAKPDFLKGFVQKPIEQIEKKIEEVKNKRKANKADAVNTGKALFEQTSENLKQLKSILGESNIKYASIADKLAQEILQCSIDYFNDCQEKEISSNYLEPAMKLAKTAEAIAVGNLTKDRIKDNIKTFEGMKDREISQAIEVLQSIKNAYETNKAKITKEVYAMPLGYNQTINWSKVNQVIENSLDWDKVVDLILKVIPQKNIEKIKNTNKTFEINEYKTLADFVISKLSYSQINKVKYLCYWKEVSPMWSSAKNITTQKTKDACYIATMAYGSYDHPQVLELRRFRDDFLSKTIAGILFIKIYYFYSPKLVEKLKNKRRINAIIRKTLNQFIKLIKAK